MVLPCAERRDETDNQATTPFGHCPSTVFLPVRPRCANARRNRCQEDLNSLPLDNWTRPSGRPRAWMKTTQQDLKSNNLFINEAILAQNHPLWRLMSIRLALRTTIVVRQSGYMAKKGVTPVTDGIRDGWKASCRGDCLRSG